MDPLRVQKAADLVAADLRRRIIRGDIAEGEALPNESALMELYDVSRPTLREALRVLENESLVSVKRGAGGGARAQMPEVGVAARYASLLLQVGGTTLDDLFEARKVIEPAAVRMLAEQRSELAIAELRAEHEREQAVLDDLDEYAAAAAVFHERIVELAGNKTLFLIARILLEIVTAHNRATFARAADDQRRLALAGCASHAHIITLIAAGKAQQAERYWRRHVEDAAQVALRHLGADTVVDLLDER